MGWSAEFRGGEVAAEAVLQQGMHNARKVSWLGGPFPSPHPRAHGLPRTQLVVCSLELGCNSDKIAEKAKCASINGILTFITTRSSCGCGKAPLNIWALFLLRNKICPGSVCTLTAEHPCCLTLSMFPGCFDLCYMVLSKAIPTPGTGKTGSRNHFQ